MFIVLKYVIKSMLEKKSRTILILLAIMLSGGLFLASIALSDSIVELYTKQARQSIGNAEIVITLEANSDDNLISMWEIKQLSNNFDYIIPAIYTSGQFRIDTQTEEKISLLGMELSDYKNMYEHKIYKQLGKTSFEGNKIIISKKLAKKYDWEVGDKMELKIGGVKRQIEIFAISESVGYFGQEQNGSIGLMPFYTITSYFDTKQKPTSIYLKTKNNEDLNSSIDKAKKLYPNNEVKETIVKEQFAEQISWIAQPLLMMSIIVMLMSIFIIYSSFKVIMIEKIPVLGTFRSVGASKKILKRVLSLESLGYGIVGGMLGNIFGVGASYIVISMVTGGNIGNGIEIKPKISIEYVVYTFILCILLSVVSSMIPILKTINIQVRDIILGTYDTSNKDSNSKSLAGLVLIVIGIVLPRCIVINSIALVISVFSIVLLIVGSILFVPMFVRILHPLFEVVFRSCFGNTGILASQNVRNNKSILNSISLVSIGIGIILMINMITTNLNIGMFDFFKTTTLYDLEIGMQEMDKTTLNMIKSYEGVDDAQGIYMGGTYSGYPVKVKTWGGHSIDNAYGVAGPEFMNYLSFKYISGDKESDIELLNKLQEGRNVIISKILQRRYSVEIGDYLEFDMPEGTRTYKIIGIADTLMNNGNISLFGEKYLKLDTHQKYYNSTLINTNKDPSIVFQSLKDYYKNKRAIWGMTTKDMLKNNDEGNAAVMNMLIGFSGLAGLIGIIGIVNNLILSIIERKKSLAILRSVGMNKGNMVKMILIEGIYCGVMGSIGGVLIGALIIYNIPTLLEAMYMPFEVKFLADQVGVYVMAGILITLVASVLPASKSSRLQIIEVIKYE